MEKKKPKRIPTIAVSIVCFLAVFALLFVIPFRRKKIDPDGFSESPIISWCECRVTRTYMEEPSNPPFVGEWNWPSYKEKRTWVVFGKEYGTTEYLVYPDGNKKEIVVDGGVKEIDVG